eukprot:gene2475-5427_t
MLVGALLCLLAVSARSAQIHLDERMGQVIVAEDSYNAAGQVAYVDEPLDVTRLIFLQQNPIAL